MDFIPSPVDGSEDMFAMVVNGDSMASSGPYSFPNGTIVTFDPRKEAAHGDFILCGIYDTNETTFKQLVIDQSQKYLKPLSTYREKQRAQQKTHLVGFIMISGIFCTALQQTQ